MVATTFHVIARLTLGVRELSVSKVMWLDRVARSFPSRTSTDAVQDSPGANREAEHLTDEQVQLFVMCRIRIGWSVSLRSVVSP